VRPTGRRCRFTSGGTKGRDVAKESGQVLGDAIRSLPEKYRTAFIMKEVQELLYEAIAQILKCSTGTIKSRLHRA
jgi:RNA polymerase sigma-70 factor (ECF subfamily)